MTGWQKIIALGTCLLGVAMGRAAQADRGDITVGGTLQVGPSDRLTAGILYGVNDWLALRLDTGVTNTPLTGRLIATFGVDLSYDAYSWVPAFILSGGGAFNATDSGTWLTQARAEIRYFISRDSWVALGAGSEVDRQGVHFASTAAWFVRFD